MMTFPSRVTNFPAPRFPETCTQTSEKTNETREGVKQENPSAESVVCLRGGSQPEEFQGMPSALPTTDSDRGKRGQHGSQGVWGSVWPRLLLRRTIVSAVQPGSSWTALRTAGDGEAGLLDHFGYFLTSFHIISDL